MPRPMPENGAGGQEESDNFPKQPAVTWPDLDVNIATVYARGPACARATQAGGGTTQPGDQREVKLADTIVSPEPGTQPG